MNNLTIGNSINKFFNTGESNLGHIQLIPSQDESVLGFARRIAHEIGERTKVVKMTCFGSLINEKVFSQEIRTSIPGNFPLTWVEGTNCSKEVMNGVSIWLTDVDAVYKKVDEHARAVAYEDNDAQYLFIGNILSRADTDRASGYRDILSVIDKFLSDNGFSFTNIVRTWYYLDNILDWYDDFNLVRTSFFSKKGVDKKLIPASTGVNGRNMVSSAVSMELLAVKPKAGTTISRVDSPLQCEAGNYGSSFSRAVKIVGNKNAFMTVSGTASIEQGGATIYPNELKKQFEYSFKVVDMMVKKEGFKISDVSRAVAYLKDKSFLADFHSFLRENPEFSLPYIVTENTICRDDLLFEVEIDLVKRFN